MTTVGLLHPGAMGATVGAAARTNGARVVWAAEGRGAATRARAEAADLEALQTLRDLAESADVVLSVCPPHGAEALADAVIATGFTGVFVDANAIRPERTRRIGAKVVGAGGRFVDGGIVGQPPRAPGDTRFYLSGPDAETVAALFRGSLQEPIVLGSEIGAASALKMAYAAWNKGAIALRLAVRALARAEGVDAAFVAEWARSQPGLAERSEGDASRVSAKAWRWVGEMEEIAATFAAAGLPGGFHEAAGTLYEAMADFKDRPTPPSFEEVMAALAEAHRDDADA
jgi:3-hydroxyisobutyrate dehydrogenase-like beta-hydroxyacid dehydrogenase